jgi:hypothetical protein
MSFLDLWRVAEIVELSPFEAASQNILSAQMAPASL